MKIKTQVNISIIIFAILSILIIFILFSANAQLQEIQKKQQIIDNIEKFSFELSLLENDYLVHGGTIPVKYWNAKNVDLAGRIQKLTLTDPSKTAKLNEISESQKELNASFLNLVAITNTGLRMDLPGKNQEKNEFYESTLAGQTLTLISRSAELSQQVKTEALEVQQRTIMVILFAIATLMVFVILNYLFINRSVLTSISALQNGSERIGSGDLDTKIDIKSNDELGNLSQTFNRMSSSLKDTRTLLLASNIELEQDVAERKRVEFDLERANLELKAANKQLIAAEEERKTHFKTLLQSEEKFREIFDTINDGIQIHEIEPDGKPGKFIEVNEVACRMLQYTHSEMISHGPLDFVTDYHSRPLNEIINELNTTGHSVFETRHQRKDGTSIPVEIHSHVVTLQGKRVMVGVVRDITDRKLTEGALQRVNQKLNVLSQLTRRDLTNQFYALSSYLDLAKKQLVGQDRIIETVQKGVREISLIRQIIEYSKDYQDMGAKPPKWQSVKMTMLLGLSHISISEIKHSIETGDLEIFTDPLLENICQRLFENSVKYGDHVTLIRVWHTITPEGATIFFEDDGIGIPQEKKEQIFLRSEGTSASRGSLIFVWEILDITGITIRETGEPGKGARFEITVPNGKWRYGR